MRSQKDALKKHLYLQKTERAAGSAPETSAALEHADAQTASVGSLRQSAAYRPASAALSLRSYGRPTGSRSSQTAARPATALAISPSRLEQKCSPNKAANASPSARKASAVITRQPGIPSLDLRDIQQENQGESASKATQMLSPSIPNAGARQALQESPTRSPNKAATSSASITQQTKEPPWREFIRSVQGQPGCREFIYLVPAAKHFADYRPYELKLVPHSTVADLADYSTMSAAGVTHFFHGQTEFTSLHQWEREYIIFEQLHNKPHFMHFRMWKQFALWRRAVRVRKTSQARETMDKQLFLLNSSLNNAILRTRDECVLVWELQLLGIQLGKVYSLQELQSSYKAAAKMAKEDLHSFAFVVVEMVKDACKETMSLLEVRMNDTMGRTSKLVSALSRSMGPRRGDSLHKSDQKYLKLAKNKIKKPDEEFLYATTASKRAERQRLVRFIRMMDYMLANALQQSLLHALAQLLDLLSGTSGLDQSQLHAKSLERLPSTISSMTSLQSGQPQPVLSWQTGPAGAQPLPFIDVQTGMPVAQLQQSRRSTRTASIPANTGAMQPWVDMTLLLSSTGDDLVFRPPVADLVRHFDNVLRDLPNTIAVVQRLLTHPDLEEHVEAGLGGRPEVGVRGLLQLADEEPQAHLTVETQEAARLAFNPAQEFRESMLTFRDLVVTNGQMSVEGMRGEVLSGTRTLESFRSDVGKYLAQQQQIKDLAPTVDCGVVRIRLQELVVELLPSPQRCLDLIHGLLPQLASEVYQAFIAEVHNATSKLATPPASPEDFADLLDFMEKLEQRRHGLDDTYDHVQAHYELLQELHIDVPPMEFAAFKTMEGDMLLMQDAVYSAEANKELSIQRFKAELERDTETLKKEVIDIRLLAQRDIVLDPQAEMLEVISYISELLAKVREQQAQAERITGFQAQFGVLESQLPELAACAEEVSLKHLLWTSLESWGQVTFEFSRTEFSQLDADNLDVVVGQYARAALKIEKGLSPNQVTPVLCDGVARWQEVVPVATALRNPVMQDRHWTKLQQELGVMLPLGPAFTLQTLFDLKLATQRDKVCAISAEATQEAALEGMLRKVQEKWSGVELTVKQYKEAKDAYILGSVEDVQSVLEDSLAMMSTICSSRFVAGVRGDVDRMSQSLRLFSDTLEEWLECQKKWLYLENIFMAPDIQRQLPNETQLFGTVDRQFKSILRITRDRPAALPAGTTPGWLEIFQSCNQTLEKVQQSLADYLEVKRTAFPRFYFLSDDELLEILSQSKNPRAVQPHLQKCFDGIASLEFGEGLQAVDVIAMISGEGEHVPLGGPMKARGGPEGWLTAVEVLMRSALKAATKRAMKEYPVQPRVLWLRQQPAQLVLLVSNIFWCKQVEDCLESPNVLASLMDLYLSNVQQLSELSDLVGEALTAVERCIMIALITIDVHNRDIVEGLRAGGCTSVSHFEWQRQLRFEFDTALDDVVIRQVNARFVYGYEYLGAQTRLVVTPMTDRCYMTLTGALSMHLGGAPTGPAGTGKTETVKDLAKALGLQCVVFNCGETLDYKFMAKFFSGLAQCGAWACFDEFNRIGVEVLSVVAQQLMTIQSALRAGVSKFRFEGKELKLIPTCGVFITMNPGYAGRTELPDNLKALFRPVAMMVPDYALVAEVMLFSEGFNTAKALSHKMVKLYKLASEQLSQQEHYDFGMRALKSVLATAGSLKRSSSGMDEAVVLIMAMRNSNMPKFLVEDAALFTAIVSDLFPATDVPEHASGQLVQAVTAACEVAGLQAVPALVNKCLQLQDTLAVRFGVMLVGPAGGGKSECYKTLRDALNLLHQADPETPANRSVTSFCLNPKSISLGELYGAYNPVSNDWKDGLASKLVREAMADDSNSMKWLVFDGPVDAVWVENLNTVLDDTRTLCLPNSERIRLDNSTMRVLFEVGDLAKASPATVSRCGMVYVAPQSLGWRPCVKSWLSKLAGSLSTPEQPVTLTQADLAFLSGLFEQYVDAGLALVRSGKCQEVISTVDINLVTSLTCLLQAMLLPMNFPAILEPMTDSAKLGIHNIFAFCYVWSIGGAIESHSRDAFDALVRNTFQGVAIFPAGAGLVYDYCCDSQRNFALRSWEETVPTFKYHPATPYSHIFVPTADTVRFGALLTLALQVQRPVLLTGSSGVGKSAVMQHMLQQQSQAGAVLPTTLTFSAQTTSIATQERIEARLERRHRNRYGPPVGKHMVLFVDDINMPAKEEFGAQPPIELLRQLLDQKGFYDRSKLFWKGIEDLTVMAACAPPGGGRQIMSSRFTRHMHTLCMPPTSEACLRVMFTAILGGFMDHQFGLDVKRALLRPMVEGSIEMYLRISQELLPTPAKAHYTFNLRDLSKVFQGLLMVKARQCGREPKPVLTRLWVHENMRVFQDRLVDTADRTYLQRLLHSLLESRFDTKLSCEEMFEKQNIAFGYFLRPDAAPEERVYQELPSAAQLATLLENYLDTYNTRFNTNLNLVLFQDAMQHICSIARILAQPRGSAMLVGVGGCGKQTLARFAAFIAGVRCFQIQVTRGYGRVELWEDLKKLYQMCGVEEREVAFLLTDSQITNEIFLEDISNILISGEVPGLFAEEERNKLLEDARDSLMAQGVPDLPGVLWTAFVARVRAKLHMVLCMSPIGDTFRLRCRQLPSLVNCCTINWFSDWPADALLSVSTRQLERIDLCKGPVVAALAKVSMEVHASVVAAADQFFQQLQRRFYITPKSFLDMLSMFTSMLGEQHAQLTGSRERLLNGLTKLHETNAAVDGMQQELNALQPTLQQKTASAEQLLAQVTQESREAEDIQLTVAEEEQAVGVQTAETAALKDDAQQELNQVLPALEAAQKALNALNKNDIIEIKTFTKPPALVQLTMEGVCILLQEEADWGTAKRVLGQPKFIERLMAYDADNIPDAVLEALQRVVNDARFTADQVAKQSNAARSMCLWVRALDVYGRMVKIVEPKRQALHQAEAALAQVEAKLAAKRSQLREVVEKVHSLKAQLSDTQTELASLQQQYSLSEKRLVRASKLISALGDEAGRWSMSADTLTTSLQLLIGDVFLAAACISYIGPLTGSYREELISAWRQRCQELSVPVSNPFSLQATLTTPMSIREWSLQGLPNDSLSVDNAIMVTSGRRWPLMIDPQCQANRWVKGMEGKLGLRVCKPGDPTLMRTLESCIRLGHPFLVEEMGGSLEPQLLPLLGGTVTSQGHRRFIRLGGSDVDYDVNFKLYMTTKLANPHYLPQVCIATNLINFTVTQEGLEAQLLREVVAEERGELEEAKERLLLSLAADTRQLQDLQDRILKLLKESEGNILDDEVLINTLNNSKLTAEVISKRVKEAQHTEAEINLAREKYRAVPQRGSILYFVVADLPLLDPMYQYSLEYFIQVFNHCVKTSSKSIDLATRLRTLIDYTTEFVFTTVCRGLFQAHRLIFSFLICTSIQRQAQHITPAEWSYLLRGAQPSPTTRPNPAPTVLTPASWGGLHALEEVLPVFKGIVRSFALEGQAWIQWLQSPEPHLTDLPASWQSEGAMAVSPVQKLCLVKLVRPECLVAAIQQYVITSLGPQFAEPGPVSLQCVKKDSNNTTPIIFILSPGCDPIGELHRLAQAEGFTPGDRLHTISLGQGQGPLAQGAIEVAAKQGHWVCLQNCHLVKSWMPELEKLVARLRTEDESVLHGSFRLWLTSMPSPHFPVSVLQSGIKVTMESPKGIKAALLRCFSTLSSTVLAQGCPQQPHIWPRLLFVLAFFHALVLERRKYGSLGWNTMYDFSDGDWLCARQTLSMFLNTQDAIPWAALQYVTGQINYGGRVTDDNDRVLLTQLLTRCYTPAALAPGFTPAEGYPLPAADASLEACMGHIQGLPAVDTAHVFSMHPNADTAFQLQESERVMSTVLSVQPRSSHSAGGVSNDELVATAAQDILAKLPALLARQDASIARDPFAPLPTGAVNSLGVVLRQEMQRYNRLLHHVTVSLQQLIKALKGLVAMSSSLEAMYSSLLNRQVPRQWAQVGYPSLKPLGPWLKDLQDRLAFFSSWLRRGAPSCFWLAAFFFPQGFLTAVLQNHARLTQTPIDQLSFGFDVLAIDDALQLATPPEIGVCVSGLHLEGARWSAELGAITSPETGSMTNPLPLVHLKPQQGVECSRSPSYSCPLYQTSARAGTLSSTGQSTNFVLHIDLHIPANTVPADWVLQGVAAICSVNK